MKFRFGLACLALAAAAGTGCGSGTEPLSIFGSTDSVTLAFPSESLVTSATPFTNCNTSDYCSQLSFGAVGTAVTAPAAGIVVGVDADANVGTIVTIRHSAHFSSRIGLASATVRKGDTVSAGSALGTTGGITTARYSATYDGSNFCPLSFLSLTSRAKIAGAPCQ